MFFLSVASVLGVEEEGRERVCVPCGTLDIIFTSNNIPVLTYCWTLSLFPVYCYYKQSFDDYLSE